MIVKKGDKGPAVRELQALLQQRGFYAGSLDGDFGQKTDAALRQFQMANNLKADGVAGSHTWGALRVVSQLPAGEADKAFLRGLLASQSVPQRPALVLEKAISDLGKAEWPKGSNQGPQIWHLIHNPFNEKQSYYDYIGFEAPDDSYPPWCALAICWWIAHGGGQWNYPFPAWFGATAQIEAWGKEKNRFTSSGGSTAWPAGAIFTMSRAGSGSDSSTAIRSGHVGLIVADEGQKVVTIEGNTGDAVAWQRRPKSSLRGYVVWW